MYELSSWKFNDEVSKIFDKHVRQSVPGYDDIQNIILHLSDFFLKPEGVVYDIGCSTGETIYRIYNRHENSNISFIGIDNSQAMLDKAKEKNDNGKNITFVNTFIENYNFEIKANLIISVLSIQFIPLEKRLDVIKKIHNSLCLGGAFIFVEKTFAINSKIQEIFTQLYHDFKEEQGLSTTEIREKDKSLRSVLVPITVEENINMLKKAGFSVDIFYKNLNFTGFLAVK